MLQGRIGGAALGIAIKSNNMVEFQAGSKKYRCKAKIMAGGKRAQLFAKMAKAYPFYGEYQINTDREIPVILLNPEQAIEHL